MYIINKGDKFNELTVIGEAKRINGKRRLICKCSCGKEIEVDGYKLRKGITKSCGCKKAEYISKRFTTHGDTESILYSKWCGIKRRCLNKNDSHYKDYGKRGIKICNDWLEYEPFKKWAINNGYNDNLTIDRIDNDGNYEPNNCRWITMKEQASNKRNTIYIKYNGIDYPLTILAEKLNINKKTLSSRYYRFKSKNNYEGIVDYNMLIPR